MQDRIGGHPSLRVSALHLRFRVGVLWKEDEDVDGRFFGLEGHVFLRRT